MLGLPEVLQKALMVFGSMIVLTVVGCGWDFLKKKLSLSARLTDVFDTFSSKTHATIDAGNGALQRELNYENYETRVFYMSLSYRF